MNRRAYHGDAIKNIVRDADRDVTRALSTVRIVAAIGRGLDATGDALAKIPTWVMQLVVGLMWLFMVVVAIGKGQDWAVFCAFLGMLWWALLERDYQNLKHDFKRALDGWVELINTIETAPGQGAEASDFRHGSTTPAPDKGAPEAGNALGAAS